MFKKTAKISEAIKYLKNDKNNAVSQVFLDAKNNPGKSLSETTYVLKDNYAHQFSSSEGSSNILKGFNAYYNATIIEKLEKAGAALVGKTNLDELGLGGTGTFSSKGIITNPLDKTRIIGGSSSGSAAVLNDSISFAIGSDTGDSVRLPASFIGKVGFKPSYGAVSRYGLYQFSSSLDTVAWFTHNVFDSNIIAKTLYGKDKKDFTSLDIQIDLEKPKKPKKIGFLDLFKYLDDETSNKFKNLINNLLKEGIDVEIIKIPEKLLKSIQSVYQIISYSEASSNLANLNGIAFGNQEEGKNWEEIMINTRSANFGYMVQKRLVLGAYFLDIENQEELFLKAQKIRRIIKEEFLNSFKKQNIDILIIPSYPTEAPKIDADFDKINEKHSYTSYILTLSNLVGNPSISIPWIKNSKTNLPINLSIDANIYEDQKLFSHALFMEQFIKEKGEK